MKTQQTKSRFDRNLDLIFFIIALIIFAVCVYGITIGHYQHVVTAIASVVFVIIFNPWNRCEW